jgi:hypothetical protein
LQKRGIKPAWREIYIFKEKSMKKKGKLWGTGIAVLTAIVFALAGCEQLADSLAMPGNGNIADFVAVTGIAGVPSAGTAGTALDLGKAAVEPEDATSTAVVWSVAEGSAVSAAITINENGTTVTPEAAGMLTLTATVANGKAGGKDFTQDFTVPVGAAFVAVTSIAGVPTGGVSGAALDLGGAAAQPNTATKTAVEWTVKDEGGTGVTGFTEGKATPQAAGVLTLTATVADGKAEGEDFTQDFSIKVVGEDDFVAVTGITGVPATGTAGMPLAFAAVTVAPETATNRTIAWSVAAGSAVSATVNGATVTPEAAGVLTLTATVVNGKTDGTENYTQDFTITVGPAFVPVTNITGVPVTGTAGTPLNFGAVTVEPQTATNQTIAWSAAAGSAVGAAITLNGNVITVTPLAAGTLKLTATVASGKTASAPYTQDFTITVAPAKSTEENTPPFTGTVTSKLKSIMSKDRTRQFTVDAEGAAVWTVEGGSAGGGTSVSETGLLAVGANEGHITLTVKAASAETGEELGTATVKVKGWQEISSGFESIFTALTNNTPIAGHTFGVQAAAYGDGLWVMGGGGAETTDYQTIKPVVAYTGDEGKTVIKGGFISSDRLIDEETIMCIIYDGPEHDKKFVAGTYRGGVLWSRDGNAWTKIPNRKVFNIVYGGNTDQPMGLLIKPIVYGNGKYIATKGDGAFAYSDDAETWTVGSGFMHGNLTGLTYLGLRYGTGLLDGASTGMFLAEYRKSGDGSTVNVYSTDGVNWTVLDEANAGTLSFKAAPPAGYNQDLSAAVDTSDVRFAGDERFTTKVYFVASGNGKHFAFGNGNRVAIAHADAYPVK